jgi:hypothetical protein
MRSISPGRASLPRRPNYSTKRARRCFFACPIACRHFDQGKAAALPYQNRRSGFSAESRTLQFTGEMRRSADRRYDEGESSGVSKGVDWFWPERIMPAKSGWREGAHLDTAAVRSSAFTRFGQQPSWRPPKGGTPNEIARLRWGQCQNTPSGNGEGIRTFAFPAKDIK